jgi:hypothetical protein
MLPKRGANVADAQLELKQQSCAMVRSRGILKDANATVRKQNGLPVLPVLPFTAMDRSNAPVPACFPLLIL